MQARTVVIVEDDPLIRSNASTLIEEAGFDVIDLETADEALAYVWKQPRQILAIFSDVQTPGHTSGADLARMVSCHWPGIFLLITSGHRRDSIVLPPSSQFLPKPWAPLDVLTALLGRQDSTLAGAAQTSRH